MRREWNNSHEWATGLMGLRHLAVFLLKTGVSLVSIPGDIRQETNLIHRWAGGRSYTQSRLHHIAIWYLSSDDRGYLRLWDIRGGNWTLSTALDGLDGPIETSSFC